MKAAKKTLLVYMDEPLHTQLKIAAATHGAPMTEIAERAIRKELERMRNPDIVREYCSTCGHDVLVLTNGSGSAHWATHQHDTTAVAR